MARPYSLLQNNLIKVTIFTASEKFLYCNVFNDPVHRSHYENVPMKFTEIFKDLKNKNFHLKKKKKKKKNIFLIFAQNIDCDNLISK